jgi:hypothetical protein
MTNAPKSLPGATKLLERFAAIEGELELIEATRSEAITKANASADAEAAPLLKERSDIVPLLASWWGLVGPSSPAARRAWSWAGA